MVALGRCPGQRPPVPPWMPSVSAIEPLRGRTAGGGDGTHVELGLGTALTPATRLKIGLHPAMTALMATFSTVLP